jgi:septum formation inhibitor MinC
MESANALTTELRPIDDAPPAALLRGTARGLEIVVDGQAATSAITAAIIKRLEEAPGFFRGSDVRVRVEEGPLAPGCLARLDEIAGAFELRIVEVAAAKRAARGGTVADADAVPQPNLAAGSAPSPAFEEEEPTSAKNKLVALPTPAVELADAAPGAGATEVSDVADLAEPMMLADGEIVALETLPDDVSFEEPTHTAVPLQLAATPEISLPNEPGTRVVIGPVRSGVILEHLGHLIIFGDINPGAEVRASGNIVVLGRLRGTAHAGIGQDVGFILALRLEPQQLRIGRQVARAADSDIPATEPELAYATGGSIIVERYQGKLPRNLATSI